MILSFAMVFFFFLIAILIIGGIYWNTRRRHVGNAFLNAASRLGLRYSHEGTAGTQPWIYGERNGIRIDIKPFVRTQDGLRRRWTGYRLQFGEPLDLDREAVQDQARLLESRLKNRFIESDLSRGGIFCARSSVAEDSSRIVSDLEYLLNAARELRSVSIAAEEPPAPTPPPLPSHEKPTIRPIEQAEEIEEIEEIEEPSEKELEEPTILREQADPGEPDSEPEVPIDQGREEIPVETEEPTETEASAPEPEEKPEPMVKAPALPSRRTDDALARAAADLFEAERNHFEIDRHFAKSYQGEVLEGAGILRQVERFSNDRVYGRGPGVLCEVEILRIGEPGGGPQVVHAIFQIPTEEDSESAVRSLLSEWREHLGETVTLCGTPTRCDSFAGTLYLAESVIDARTPA